MKSIINGERAFSRENLGDVDEIDLLAVGRSLWRRKGLIVGTTLILTALVAASISLLVPKYSATAYIMIDPGQTKIVDAVEAVVAGAAADSATVASETRVLQSRNLADRVITKLQLDKDPEFNTTLQPPGLLDPLKDAVAEAKSGVKQWLQAVLGDTGTGAGADQDPALALRARIIANFLGDVDVSIDGRSRVIGVTFTSESADTAANAVNALADLYIVGQLEAKFAAAKTANEWLNGHLAELRQQVEASEDAVERYRAEYGLIQNKDVMVSTQEATDLGSQLAIARSQRAEAEARLKEVHNAIGKPNGVAAVSEVLDSRLIQQLQEQEMEAQRKVSDLGEKLGPRHPDLLSATAELEQVRAKIGVEVGKVVQKLQSEVATARAREASLTDTLKMVKTEAGEQNQSEVKLRALEREATASRTLLETFLQRAQETSSQANYQQADAHIVSKADVPQTPAFPKKKVIILVGFVMALCISVLLAFLLEFLDRSLHSEEDVEQTLGVASLGLVPSLKRSWGRSSRASAYVVQHPASAYVESMRNLYTGLRLSSGDHLPRTMLIASSLPNEGKTTVAVSLASLLSAAGLKTIVVDTDLRKSTIHSALSVAAEPGLVDYLKKRVPLPAAIQHDKTTGVDVITAGSTVANPPDLLGTDQMKELLAQLEVTYDAVILDSAPLLAVSDTRVLLHLVDKVVFLVRWADTRRDVALRGLHQIGEANNNLAGTMLTMVDFAKYAKYRYGSFGTYYRQIQHYYAA